MSAKLASQLDFYNEFLDQTRFADQDYERRFKDFLREKYATQKMDLIIAFAPGAVEFLQKYRAELFPNVPLVFCGVTVQGLRALKLGPQTTGVVIAFDSAATLGLALQLQPDTRHVVVVAGNSRVEQVILEASQEGFAKYQNQLDFKYLTGLPIPQIQQELAHLPKHSIVFFIGLLRDEDGRTFTGQQVLEMISPQSNAPVYGLMGPFLGHGIVGGRLANFDWHGVQAGNLGLRILAGEAADNIPVTSDAGVEPFSVDWRELKRFGLSESKLPSGTVLRFKQFSFWELYKWWVVSAAALCVVETLLITALLFQRRKRATASRAVTQSEERLRSIIDNTSAVIYLKDEAGRYLLVNKQFEKSFKLTNEAVVGRTDFELFSPEIARGLRANDAQVFSSKAPLEFEEVLSQNGQSHTYVSVKVPLPLDNRRVMCGISTDITARKEAEAELGRQREELTHYARVAAMGELTASLAHELNQPLTAILSNAQAAQRFLQNEPPDLDELTSILTDVIADDRRASQVIQRLRTLLKRGEVEMLPHDLNALISEVRSLINSDVLIKNVPITLELDPALPPVQGDRVQLQQVILNLLINAMDAVSANRGGSRDVIIKTFHLNDKEVQVEVVDSGPGISENDLKRVFESFYTTKAEGLGMGLSISRSIVERHDGRLWATNNSDRGATFHFTVPISHEV